MGGRVCGGVGFGVLIGLPFYFSSLFFYFLLVFNRPCILYTFEFHFGLGVLGILREVFGLVSGLERLNKIPQYVWNLD